MLRLVLVTILSAVHLLAQAVQAETLTVATWNLAHLAAEDGAGCRPRRQAEYDELSRIISLVDADVWLLQEVESRAALARIMDPDTWTLFVENRSAGARGTCRGGKGKLTMQRIAIAVKRDIATGSARELRFLDVHGNASLRYGLSVPISLGARVIEIINVHLKSGCPSGSTAPACPVLFEQAPYLASYLSQIDGADLPILLGGDFNRRLGKAGDDVLTTLRYNKRVGMEIASAAGTSRCSLRGDLPIDYILTSKAFRSVFEIEEAYEHSFAGPFRDWPSDHCPTVVRFKF